MPQRGKPATPKQREALAAGQKKRAQVRQKMREDAHAAGMPTAGERWSMLLDGRLLVSDLDDKEIAKMKLRGSDGSLSGRPRMIPSHIAQAFRSEQLRRAQVSIQRGLPKAVEEMDRILKDPEASNADKIKVINIFLERSLGKTPETIRIKADDKFADMLETGGVLKDVRDLSDLEQS